MARFHGVVFAPQLTAHNEYYASPPTEKQEIV